MKTSDIKPHFQVDRGVLEKDIPFMKIVASGPPRIIFPNFSTRLKTSAGMQ